MDQNEKILKNGDDQDTPTSAQLTLKWQTSKPIRYDEAETGIAFEIGACGEAVLPTPDADQDGVVAAIAEAVEAHLADVIRAENINIRKTKESLGVLSSALLRAIADELNTKGIQLTAFEVTRIAGRKYAPAAEEPAAEPAPAVAQEETPAVATQPEAEAEAETEAEAEACAASAEAEQEAPAAPADAASPATPYYRRALMHLDRGEFDKAEAYGKKAIRLDSACAEAHVVMLLVELKLNHVGDLAESQVAFHKSENYQNALQHASSELKEMLEGYSNAVLARLIESKKEAYYAKAMELMEAARYEDAAAYLSKIEDYSDAAQKLEECRSLAETARQEAIYAGALERAAAPNADDTAITQSIEDMKSISGYRDADDKVKELEEQLAQWLEQKRIAEEEARIKREAAAEKRRIKRAKTKKAIIRTLVALLVLSVISTALIATLLIHGAPAFMMNRADKMVEEGNYAEAEELYAFLNRYDKLNVFPEGDARVVVLESMKEIDKGNFEQAIKKLLAAGVPVEVSYATDGGDFSGTEYVSGNGYSRNPVFSLVDFSEMETELLAGRTSNYSYLYTDPPMFKGLMTPTMAGYGFVEWELGGYSYQPDGNFALTLKAVWDEREYTISYDLQGAQSAGRNPSRYGIESADITLSNPTRVGYTFAGWTGTGLTSPTVTVVIEQGSTGNRSYKATWKANTNTVTFHPEGGVLANSTLTVTYDQAYTLPAPIRIGYTFDGWFASDGTQYVDGTWKNTADLELYARWTATAYTITYNLNGGSFNTAYGSPAYEYYVTSAVTLANPIKPGAEFLGWTYAGQTTPVKNAQIPVGSTGSKTFTAHWEAIPYTITFDANGGSVDSSSMTVYYGDRYTLPTPTLLGYTFIGWVENSIQVSNSGTWNREENVHLTAYWTVSNYTLTLNDTDGYAYAPGSVYQTTVVYNTAYTLPDLTRDGYTFLGWFNGETQVEAGTWTFTEDLTLTPGWQALCYTVTFDGNGGGLTDTSWTVTYDAEYTLPTPTRTGYTFAGWFNGDVPVLDGAWQIPADTVLVARWTANQYTVTLGDSGAATSVIVTFDPNYEGASPASILVDAEHPLVYPDIPTREGYLFAGWYTDAACNQPYAFSGTIGQDTTLYARWISHGGVGNPILMGGNASIYVSAGDNIRYFAFIPLVTQTVTIYSQSSIDTYGYLYDENLTQLTYDDDAGEANNFSISYSVEAGTLYFIGVRGVASTASGNVTVCLEGIEKPANTVALGSGIQYTPGSLATMTATYDSLFELPQFTMEGYDFLGWFIVDGETQTKIESGTWSIAGDVTLTPMWQTARDTLTFDADGGELEQDQNSLVVYWGEAYTLPTPTRTGYTFNGWFNGETQITDGTWFGSEDMILTASWTANTYNLTWSDMTGTAPIVITVDYNYEGAPVERYALLNGQQLTLDTIPTRDGYIFVDWYTDKECTQVFYFGTCTADQTLYAKWIELDAGMPKIHFGESLQVTLNGGEYVYYAFVSQYTGYVSFRTTGSVDTYGALFDSSYNFLTSNNDNGGSNFAFDYWVNAGTLYYIGVYEYNGVEAGAVTTLEIPSNVGLLKTITASCDFEYAEGTSVNTTVSYGDMLVLPELTKTGYTFLGWFNGETKVETGAWSILSDMTLVPMWDANDYTLTLDTNGGEGTDANMTVTYDAEYTLPTPTRTGYTFAGWFVNGVQLTDGVWAGTESLTLVAAWTANSYDVTFEDAAGQLNVTVSYDPNYEGSAVTSVILSGGDALAYPDIPTREGYIFAGWYTDADCTSIYDFSGTISADMTLYAKWVENVYNYPILSGNSASVLIVGSNYNYFAFVPLVSESVSFYSSCPINNIDVVGLLYDANLAQLARNDDGAGNGQFRITYEVTAGTLYYVAIHGYSTSTSGDAVLHVTRTNVPTSTAVADANIGMTDAPGSSSTASITYGANMNLPQLFREGYDFLGWYIVDGETQTKVESGAWSIAENVTLTPMWQTARDTLTFDADGGEVSPGTLEVFWGESYTLPTPTRTGYIFGGWFSQGIRITDGIWSAYEDMTLEAYWTPNTYTLTYSSVLGTAPVKVTFDYRYDGAVPVAVMLANGQTLLYPDIPTREGYLFAGWYTDVDCYHIYDFSGTVSADMTLYANWIPVDSAYNTIQIGGTAEVTLDGSNYIYYAFVPLVSGTVDFYTEGEADTYGCLYNASMSFLTSNNDGSDHNFRISYSVSAGILYYIAVREYDTVTEGATTTLHVDGVLMPTGTAVASCSFDYTVDSTVTSTVIFSTHVVLPELIRQGYTFVGWYNGDTKIEAGAWSIASDVTLTPGWQANDYIVTLDPTAGAFAEGTENTVTVTYDAAYTLPTPTRVGYTFAGWYNGVDLVDSATWNIAGDVTLTAAWTPNTDVAYTVNHYLQTAAGDYVLGQTDNLTGTADALITPDFAGIPGYVNPPAQNVTVAPDGSLVVDYYYTRGTFTLSFVTNGGDAIGALTQAFETDIALSTPTREGYTFGGWYSDAALTQEFTSATMPGVDTTLYAYWSEESRAGDFVFSGLGTYTIDGYSGTDPNVVIPAYIAGNPVTRISSTAFAGNTSIISVVAPASVTQIDSGSFAGCTALTGLVLPVSGSVGVVNASSTTVQNNSATPWVENEGVLSSTNKTNNSSSAYSITANIDMILSFDYRTSSESNYDKLIISYNGQQVYTTSGETQYQTYSYSLRAGDVLTLTYSKDGSQSTGDDCAYICNFTYESAGGAGTFASLFGTESAEGTTEVVQGGISYYVPTTLTDVTVTGNTVVYGAFENMTTLTTVNLPNAVNIGANAFKNCTGLTAVNSETAGSFLLPETLTTIGAGAFEGVTGIITLVIPDGVTSIGEGAFKGCSAIESITLPFVGSNSSNDNTTSSVFGYIFGGNGTVPDDGTIMQYYTNSTANFNFYYIPTSIRNVTITKQTNIPFGAFSNCYFIVSVNLPAEVENIGAYAFYGCAGLSRVNSQTDGTASLPEGLEYIFTQAFYGCTSLTNVTVPNSVVTIDVGAFQGCTSITDITLPFVGRQRTEMGTGVNYVLGYIFGHTPVAQEGAINQYYAYCFVPTSLKNVTITDQNYVPSCAFYGCTLLESITLNFAEEAEVTIADYAFYHCYALSRLNSEVDGVFNIPDNVIIIDGYAFAGCLEYNTLVLGRDTRIIGNHTFEGCLSLTDVVFGSSLKTIGEYAFAGCTSLCRVGSDVDNTVNIPAGVESIGSYAFQNAISITTLVVGDDVTEIGTGAFNGCNALVDVTLPFVGIMANLESGSNAVFGVIFGTTDTSTQDTTDQGYTGIFYTIPTTIRSVTVTKPYQIPAKAFYGCNFIESITLPADLTTIGEYAFYGCIGLTTLNSDTAGTFNIPTTVTSLDIETFAQCYGMKSFTCGNLTDIAANAFRDCTGLEEAILPDSLMRIGPNAFNGCISLEKVTTGAGLQSIGDNAFDGCTSLSMINSDTANTAVIPDHVTDIGNAAFMGCEAIHHWTLPFVGLSASGTSPSVSVFGIIFGYGYSPEEVPGTTWQYNSSYKYYIPTAIKSVTITSQTVIPAYAFQNCSFIEEINLPAGTTDIGTYAFQNCTGLKRLNSDTDGFLRIPEMVTELSDYVFNGCTSITHVIGGENLETIGSYAFADCTSLGEVNLGTEITTIENYAFSGCTALSRINSTEENTVNLPYGLTTIGTRAFQNAGQIVNLTIPVSVTNIGQGAFKGCEGLVNVTLPFIGSSIYNSSVGVSSPFGWIFDYTNDSSAVDGTVIQYHDSYKYYIPQSIRTVTVTLQNSIPAYAFHNCTFITEVNLLNTMTMEENTNPTSFDNCPATVTFNVVPVIAPAWDGSTVASGYQSGTGTQDDPYVIFNGEQLAYLAQEVNNGNSYEGVYFKLGADILMGRRYFTVIGPDADHAFKGTLDGNGHVIRDIYFEGDTYVIGLFGYLEGTVCNLGIEGISINCSNMNNSTTDAYVGGLAAYLGESGRVENCYVRGSIYANYATNNVYVGGLVGYNMGSIVNSYASGSVSSHSSIFHAYAGGIVAYNGGTVTGCVAYNDVAAYGLNQQFSYNGGVVAENEGTLTNVYRHEGQTLTCFGTETIYNTEGTEASYGELKAYYASGWDGTVWNIDPKLPVLQ